MIRKNSCRNISDFPFGKNFLICLLIFSTLGFWLNTYESQKNNLHLSSPVILEKQIPSISVKQGSLSVRITGINSIKFSVPIFSSKSSKNLITLLPLGLVMISSIVNFIWVCCFLTYFLYFLSYFTTLIYSHLNTYIYNFLGNLE